MLAGTSAVSRAQDAQQALREATLAAIRRTSSAPFAAAFDPSGKLTTLRGRFATASARPPTAAREFLGRTADLLRIPPDLAGLQLAREVRDRGGSTVVFEQNHHGVQVFESAVLVGVDSEGSVIHVRNQYVPDLALSPEPALSGAAAVTIAESTLGAQLPPLRTAVGLVIVRGDRGHQRYHLAWQVSAIMSEPRGDWHVFVDAHTGEVVRVLNMLKSTGSACVPCNPLTDFDCGTPFHHHPVDALDNTALTNASNVDAAQSDCTLRNLTSGTNLTGLWANTSITAGRVGPPYDYRRSANQQAVDELTAYYHADRAKAYLDALGFAGVMAFSIAIDAHDPLLGDNAQYVPSGDYMEFGEGGVDDAQDPDIVYHEYGHAIQDNQVPNFGTTEEGGAAGEGFGDYWAAALTDDLAATALGTACLAAWDAVSYNPYNSSPGSGCLRRLDGNKQYPRDFVWEVHDDGEMWSAALWNLRAALGSTAADSLVIKSHTFLTSNANFIDAADALLSADVALNGGINAVAIDSAMAAQGIARTGSPVPTSGMTESVSFSCQTGHPYSNFAYKECRFTVPGAQRVRFHFSSFDTESGYDFVYISDADYRQVEALSGTPFGPGGSGFSAAVAGDTIVARFKADPLITASGFAIDHVSYATDSAPTPTATSVPTPTPTGACAEALNPGYAGSLAGDCGQEWCSHPAAAPTAGLPGKRLECTDDDPQCDFGASAGDGMCTFRVALCFNVAEGRWSCDWPGAVSEVHVRRPRSLSTDPIEAANRAALEGALAGLGGTLQGRCVNAGPNRGLPCSSPSACDSAPGRGDGECRIDRAVFDPPLTASDTCAAVANIQVPLRQTTRGPAARRYRLKISVKPPDGSRDRDVLDLICRP